MIQKIYHWILLFKEYLLFSLLIIISLALLFLNDNSQIRYIRSITIASVGVVQETFSFIPHLFSLQQENDVLREINIQLADEVGRLREAHLENIRLRELIGLKQENPHQYLAGKVISKNVSVVRNTLTIDRGEADSVHIGNPIVTPEGLVGKIVVVGKHHSIVQILSNVDFRASAKIQRSRVDGILAWDGKSLLLKNIVKSMDVKQGDVIITSEYSNAFPHGIKIGVVQSIEEIPGNLFKKIEISPSVNFLRTEEIFVMDFVPTLEKLTNEKLSIKNYQ